MNLPFIFDLATGLIFIYLILSLLTSEIQEIIATLLQWRAEHLKKSIEILLTGSSSQDPTSNQFANELYNSSFIQSLNQEAKGPIARSLREWIKRIGALYRSITRTRNVFDGQDSGPSYIPNETFASALLNKLDIEALTQKVSELTLKRFSQEKIALIQDMIDTLRNSTGDRTLLESELATLKRNLTEIYDDLINHRITLAVSIDNATNQLVTFIDNTSAALGDEERIKTFIQQRLPYIKQAVFLRKVEPTIAEVISMIVDQNQNLAPQLAEIVARINKSDGYIPQQLKDNLISLSKRAQLKTQGLEDGVRQLEKEIEDWFDHSMDRASGVYKRNAKGIAILIGFVVAVASNTDSFHIINRLSKDTILRSTISQTASGFVTQNAASTNVPSGNSPYPLPPVPPENATSSAPIQQNLNNVRSAVDQVLNEIPLPIGWDAVNVSQQVQPGDNWFISYLKRSAGWLVSGIALSMGANFWFDLLGKIIRVRSSGRPPRQPSSDE
jgi:hypothetical protein